ncbi:MAG: YdiU family protein [Candidatus Competibacterales bacterium]|nr:YdiU family protein [Candidatus Competibacterales bacterium]
MDASIAWRTLADLKFDNRFTRELPADPRSDTHRRQVTGACYSRVRPTPASAPRLVAWSPEMAERLDLAPEACATPEFAEVFAGNRLLEGMDPHATCYGGHQFGNWAGQLGDGRAINLGEVVNTAGERWVLQLKGAGPTPYARMADGYAVLRSSVREFLCSEAMHHLGVPTTRALSLVLTGETVVRDMFYDGRPEPEPGAVVCRVAPSFTRFGHFQLYAARGEHELLRRFTDYTLTTDFPHLGLPGPETYQRWFEEVCNRTADLIVHWQRVGFVHGVMNTDNMSILGQTIDYGPYGWLEDYDPDWTPNTTDAGSRRYRFANQPQIALWNLVQLANAIHPLIGATEPLEQALQGYAERFRDGWQAMMSAKLGFERHDAEVHGPLIAELLELLERVETDMTLFFRGLAEFDPAAAGETEAQALPAPLEAACYAPGSLDREHCSRTAAWLRRYADALDRAGVTEDARRQRMNRVNPRYVLRNYLAQLAIDAAGQGDFSVIEELQAVLRRPYDEQPGMERYAAKRPEWARHRPGCSMLSCSS